MKVKIIDIVRCSPGFTDVINQQDCDYHKYADDSQLEDDAPPCDVPLAIDRLEQCID